MRNTSTPRFRESQHAFQPRWYFDCGTRSHDENDVITHLRLRSMKLLPGLGLQVPTASLIGDGAVVIAIWLPDSGRPPV